METIDALVLVLYFVATLGVGFWAGRKEKDTHDFLLGGRQINWVIVAFSILATETSAVTFVGAPGDAYSKNMAFLQLAIGSIAARVAIAFMFIPSFYRFNVTTIYEFLGYRFGPRTRNTSAGFFLVTRFLASAVRLLAAAIALKFVLGLNLFQTILIVAAVTMLYAVWGGIKAIIWTDVLQFFIFFGAAVLAAVYLLNHIPDGWHQLPEWLRSGGHFQIFDLRWDWSSETFIGICILNGFFMTFAALGTDQDLTQKMLTCKDSRSSQYSLILTGLIDVPIMFTFLLVGALLFVFYQHFPRPDLPTDGDEIFPFFIMTQMPVGLRGIMIAGVLAAAMSTLSSSLGSLTSSLIVDVYKPYIRRGASERHYLFASRISVVLVGIVLSLIAYLLHGWGNILWLGFRIGSFTYGALLGIFLLGVTWKRGHDKSNMIAMLSSTAVVTVFWFLGKYHIVNLAWLWYIVIGTLWTYIFAWIMSLVTRAPRRIFVEFGEKK